MGKRTRVTSIVAAFVGLALIGVGGASAAAALGDQGPTESVLSTASTLSVHGDESTETTLLPDSDSAASTEAESFGQTISGLRHAGDHTPAAVLKGKDVPGWDPDKHAAGTSDTTVSTAPGSETADASGDDEDEGLGPNGSSGNSGEKDHVPAAVLKGKSVPGWSK
jgi:hypothetical protein